MWCLAFPQLRLSGGTPGSCTARTRAVPRTSILPPLNLRSCQNVRRASQKTFVHLCIFSDSEFQTSQVESYSWHVNLCVLCASVVRLCLLNAFMMRRRMPIPATRQRWPRCGRAENANIGFGIFSRSWLGSAVREQLSTTASRASRKRANTCAIRSCVPATRRSPLPWPSN